MITATGQREGLAGQRGKTQPSALLQGRSDGAVELAVLHHVEHDQRGGGAHPHVDAGVVAQERAEVARERYDVLRRKGDAEAEPACTTETPHLPAARPRRRF
ncbi:hypothetical protein OG876_28705 [Kribbella sp. NBC_00359]